MNLDPDVGNCAPGVGGADKRSDFPNPTAVHDDCVGASCNRLETAWNHIRDLRPDQQNRRQHNPRNIGMVVDALHKVGAARSIVIDENGTVLAGNATLEAAAEAGITRLEVVDADGETIIAVRRRGLTEEQKRALALYDNRAAELATWDLDRLCVDANGGLDLSAFFEPTELADLLGANAPVPDFTPTPESAQGHLDQLQGSAVTCPGCGRTFNKSESR